MLNNILFSFDHRVVCPSSIDGGPGWLNELDYLTTHTSLSPIRRGFASGFVNYKKGCIRFAAASDKIYPLLAHGRWFSAGSPTSSTTKTGRHDIAEILLKVALNTKDQSINRFTDHDYHFVIFKLSYYYL